jgi:hypothetical protein
MAVKHRGERLLLNISNQTRQELVSELRFVGRKIAEEPDVSKKIYFYSAAFGVFRRLLSTDYDSSMVLAEFVLEVSYNTFNSRATAIRQGDVKVPFIEGFFDRLVAYLEELARRIAENDNIYPALERIMVLAHITTGMGYYLYVKGMAKL